MKTLARLGCLLSVLFFAVNAKTACLMNQQTLMSDVEQCMEHDLGLALTIAKHMNNPSSMETPQFLCDHQSQITDLAECLIGKLVDCVPEQRGLLLSILPNKQRMQDTFQFMCKHKDMLKDNCMRNTMDSFMPCYSKKVQTLSSTTLAGSLDPQKMVCSVVRSEMECIEENKGTCSADFISFIKQVLGKVFPLHACPEALDAVMLRGQPMYFQPFNKDRRGYDIHQ